MFLTRSIGVLTLILLALPASGMAQIGLRTANPEPSASGLTMSLLGQQGEEEPCETIKNRRFPTVGAGPAGTRCFWGQEKQEQEFLKYGGFVNSSKTVSATTEIMSDAFGPVRVALSTAIAANTDDDVSDDADEPTPEEDRLLNLFAANGGNLALTASFPLYFKPMGEGGFLWNTYLRTAVNMSALGESAETTTKWEDLTGNVELAFTELKVDMLSQEKRFNLMGYVKTSGVVATRNFADALGADVSSTFLHGQAGVGMRMGQVLSIYLAYNWYSDDDIPNERGTITFSMSK